MDRKLKVVNPVIWDHHRSGWKKVISAIQETLHSETGILFDGHADGGQVKDEPWVGFIHSAPNDLEFFLKDNQASIRTCKGIWTLSQYCKEYLDSHNVDFSVNSLIHPTEMVDQLFDFTNFEHRIIFIGGWLRNWQAIHSLKTKLQKCILEGCILEGQLCTNYGMDYRTYEKIYNLKIDHSVAKLGRLSDSEYDWLLSRNIVFLPLFDTSACNTLIECIVRNTPVLTNRLPASEEYLGRDYPMFYETIKEAGEMADDLDLIQKTNRYLSKMNKEQFKIEYFIDSLYKSEIYQSI